MSRCVGGSNMWGACGHWMSPKRRGIMGSGDKVSRRAVGHTLWVAYEGWLSRGPGAQNVLGCR